MQLQIGDRLISGLQTVQNFGVNKKREIARLVYEISKREGILPEEVIKEIVSKHAPFARVKENLLRRRFPDSYSKSVSFRIHLPKLELPEKEIARVSRKFYPKKIYFEKQAENSSVLLNFKNRFPKADLVGMGSLKEFMDRNRGFDIEAYNRRKENVFLIRQSSDYFKKCPCTKEAVSCGYHVFNLGFGCIFDCTYCFLQEYTNIPGIVFPVNLEDYFGSFAKYKRKGMRLGTGEFSDSLMLDDITGYSSPIVAFCLKFKFLG